MRQDALARAQEGAANLSLILERDISRNLEIYELSMYAVIDGVKDTKILRLSPAIRQLVLFDRFTTATDVGTLLVTDEQGNLVLDSRSTPPVPSISLTAITSRYTAIRPPSGCISASHSSRACRMLASRSALAAGCRTPTAALPALSSAPHLPPPAAGVPVRPLLGGPGAHPGQLLATAARAP